MTLLSVHNGWARNMLISGFVLGTVIFALFLWQAVKNYLNVKQIRRFKGKTKNYYEDKTALIVIRSIEVLVCLLWIAELVMFAIAMKSHTTFMNYGKNYIMPEFNLPDPEDKFGEMKQGLDYNSYSADQINWILDNLVNAMPDTLSTYVDKVNHASKLAMVSNILFLVNAVAIVCYEAISYLWNSSIIVAVDGDQLITTNAIVQRNAITVSRVLAFPKVFKITFKDPDLRGNLKETRIKYSKKMDVFLSRNNFYEGAKDD